MALGEIFVPGRQFGSAWPEIIQPITPILIAAGNPYCNLG
jgi:hypothetical protein